MKTRFVALSLLIAVVCINAHAEVLDIGSPQNIATATRDDVQIPRRGSSQASVTARYGEPRQRLAAVGQPPITRWVYDAFTVYFEGDHVIHAVINK